MGTHTATHSTRHSFSAAYAGDRRHYGIVFLDVTVEVFALRSQSLADDHHTALCLIHPLLR